MNKPTPMKLEHYYYDIYPMVFPAGEPVEFTIKPLGEHRGFPNFKPNTKIVVQRLDSGALRDPFTAWNHTDFGVGLKVWEASVLAEGLDRKSVV